MTRICSLRGLLAFVVLSGCFSSPRPPKDLPHHTSVDALVAECRTMYCPKAHELAQEVIRQGSETLPALEAAWKWADDPDVMVWTWACIECIKGKLSIDQYRAHLREQMQAGVEPAATRAARHLCIMGEQEGFEFVLDVTTYAAGMFNLDFDDNEVLGVFNKRPSDIPMMIKALNSSRPSIRDRAYGDLRFSLNLPRTFYHRRESPFVKGGWDGLPPEEQKAFIEECNKRWEAKRYRLEGRVWGPELRAEFLRRRRIFE